LISGLLDLLAESSAARAFLREGMAFIVYLDLGRSIFERVITFAPFLIGGAKDSLSFLTLIVPAASLLLHTFS
jgi:hypothetical protein